MLNVFVFKVTVNGSKYAHPYARKGFHFGGFNFLHMAQCGKVVLGYWVIVIGGRIIIGVLINHSLNTQATSNQI